MTAVRKAMAPDTKNVVVNPEFTYINAINCTTNLYRKNERLRIGELR
jgi:hypothetical protein